MAKKITELPAGVAGDGTELIPAVQGGVTVKLTPLQLNGSVIQAVANDTNIQGTVAAQTLTFAWGGTLAAARLNANVVQAVTNDTNVRGSISAQNLTFSWLGQLGLSRGGTNADLSATGGAGQYLKQASAAAAVTVGTIPASDIASGAAITKVDDTNVTLTLGGTPATAALKATSLTLGWTGTLAASRGGTGISSLGTGVATALGINVGSAGAFVTFNGALGTPSSGTLTSCTGLPLAGLAAQAAWTFLVNNTSGSATPTAQDIHSLTVKASPASTDEVIIWDIAGSALKKATVSGIGASSGVSSIATNTGAFTLSHGLTNSTNDLRVDLSLFKGYLFGCILSTAGSSATFSVTAGSAVDSTGADFMALSAISKTTSGWAVGSGNGGIDTGAVANSTWYHVHVIKRTDTNVVDVLFSLSATSPTMPTNYTLFRRIGAMKTNGSAQWTLFQQSGDTFLWDVPIQDAAATNPGTAAVSRTLTAPTGVVVEAIYGVADQAVSTNHFVLLSPLSLTDQTPSSSIFSYSAQAAGTGITSFTAGGQFRTLTNTSAQIRSRASASGASDTFTISTIGWVDTRGRVL